MKRLAFNRLASLGAVALFCSGALFSACSSDNNNQPTPSDHPEAGTGATKSTGGKGGSGGGTGNATGKGGSGNTAGSGTGNSGNVTEGGAGDSGTGAGGTNPDSGTGGTAGSGTGGTGGGDAGPACTQDPKKTCGTCPAATTDEFLNHCTDSKCISFDNSKLEKLVNGKLPDLP